MSSKKRSWKRYYENSDESTVKTEPTSSTEAGQNASFFEENGFGNKRRKFKKEKQEYNPIDFTTNSYEAGYGNEYHDKVKYEADIKFDKSRTDYKRHAEENGEPKPEEESPASTFPHDLVPYLRGLSDSIDDGKLKKFIKIVITTC